MAPARDPSLDRGARGFGVLITNAGVVKKYDHGKYPEGDGPAERAGLPIGSRCASPGRALPRLGLAC